jgi:hypothetical protein
MPRLGPSSGVIKPASRCTNSTAVGRTCYSERMAGKSKKSHPGRGGMRVSLAPLTSDQALAGLLRVKPEDVKRLEAAEKTRKLKKK